MTGLDTGVTVSGADEFRRVLPDLVAVYKAAFLDVHEPDPVRAAAERTALMQSHADRRDLLLATARDDAGRVHGFGYSYRGAPGQWWHDVVARALTRESAGDWLGDCREVVELHVLPTAQGAGLGRRLLRAILDGTPERTSALSALEPAGSRARNLYASEGFIPLLSDFRFPGASTAYAVLGKRLLPAAGGRAAATLGS